MNERSTRCPPRLRILSAVLAVAMILTLLPVTAFATTQYKTIGRVQYVQYDGAIIWRVIGYSGSESSLTLESQIYGQNVYIIDEGVFKNKTNLTQVTLPANLGDIYDEAFAGCANLTSPDIPKSLKMIGARAFQGCTSLKNIVWNGRSWVTADTSAFAGCTSLESVIMSGTPVTLEDNAFEGCTSLKSVELGGSSIEIGNNVFKNCTSLEEITLPKEIESFGDNVFDGCTSLKKIIYNGKSTEWEACPAKDKIPASVTVEFAVPLEEYGLSVCGTTANEANCSNVLGDGKVEYSPDSQYLKLNNVNLSRNDASAVIDSTLDRLTIGGDGDDTIENVSGPAIKTTGKLYLDSSHIVLKGSPAIVAESVTIDAYECWYRTASDEPYAEYTESVDIGNTNYLEIIHSQYDPNETGITLWIDGKRMPEEERYDVFGDGTVLLREYKNTVRGEMYGTLYLKNANWESADTAIQTMVDQLMIIGSGTIKGGNNSIRSENTGTLYGAEVMVDEANLTFTGGLDLDAGASIIDSTVKINGWTEYGIKAGSNLIIDRSDVTIQDASGVGEYALCPQLVEMRENSTLRLQGAKSIVDGGNKKCIIYAGNYWYRTSPDDEYTKGTEKVFQLSRNDTYYELTTIDPYAVKNYDLWVAGKRVTETNQNDVLDDGGSVKFDPETNTLTLNDANLTLDENADDGGYCCIDSELEEELTITGTATLSNADGIMTAGPLTLDGADLTLTGNDEDGGEDAIRAGDHSDKDLFLRNSKVTIAGTNSEGNFFHFGIRCGNLTVSDSTLDVKTYGSAIVADEMKASGADTIVTAETDSEDEGDFALALDDETSLPLNDGLSLLYGKVNESKSAKIAQPEQKPDPTGPSAYWVVRPGDKPAQSMQIPGAIIDNEEEAHLFVGWFLEDGTRLEDSRYYMGPGVGHVGNLDKNVTFHGLWCTPDELRTLTFEDCTVEVNSGLDMGYAAASSPVQVAPGARVALTLDESAIPEGMIFDYWVIDPRPEELQGEYETTAVFTMPDANADVKVKPRTTAESTSSGSDFGTFVAAGAVVGVAGAVAYNVGTELILDRLLHADVSTPKTRAELALLLWNTAGRPEPANAPVFADVADPETAKAAQWTVENGLMKGKADGTFHPDKSVAKWRVIEAYRQVKPSDPAAE